MEISVLLWAEEVIGHKRNISIANSQHRQDLAQVGCPIYVCGWRPIWEHLTWGKANKRTELLSVWPWQVCQGCLHQWQHWDDRPVCLELPHCTNAAGVPADSWGEPDCREWERHRWHKALGSFCLLTIPKLLVRFCWERNPSGVLPTWNFPDPLGEENTWDLVLARSSSVRRGGSLFPYHLIHRWT